MTTWSKPNPGGYSPDEFRNIYADLAHESDEQLEDQTLIVRFRVTDIDPTWDVDTLQQEVAELVAYLLYKAETKNPGGEYTIDHDCDVFTEERYALELEAKETPS